MLAAQVRSGLVETFHEGAVAVFDSRSGLIAHSGDIDRPFYLRSAAKPFQALASQHAGAGLEPLELAMACASHRGHSVQIALVQSMLERAGLDEDALGCPADWPLSAIAARDLIAAGAPGPRRIWHNCSGKHAGFMRACVAMGWPLGSYLQPDHPLQRAIVDIVARLGDLDVEPVGVDGCGAPVPRTTTRAMARLFAHLGGDPELSEIFAAMHRYPALVSVNGAADAGIAVAAHAAAKGGAAGCIGVALAGGRGIAVKCWDGSFTAAGVAAAAAVDQLGGLTATGRSALDTVMSPVVLGGGAPQGRVESRLELRWE